MTDLQNKINILKMTCVHAITLQTETNQQTQNTKNHKLSFLIQQRLHYFTYHLHRFCPVLLVQQKHLEFFPTGETICFHSSNWKLLLTQQFYSSPECRITVLAVQYIGSYTVHVSCNKKTLGGTSCFQKVSKMGFPLNTYTYNVHVAISANLVRAETISG